MICNSGYVALRSASLRDGAVRPAAAARNVTAAFASRRIFRGRRGKIGTVSSGGCCFRCLFLLKLDLFNFKLLVFFGFFFFALIEKLL